jgi:hypothetical protein
MVVLLLAKLVLCNSVILDIVLHCDFCQWSPCLFRLFQNRTLAKASGLQYDGSWMIYGRVEKLHDFSWWAAETAQVHQISSTKRRIWRQISFLSLF